ncbi:MAG: hypothetical protein AAB508_06140, partial [Patescibacteria group bacterium]
MSIQKADDTQYHGHSESGVDDVAHDLTRHTDSFPAIYSANHKHNTPDATALAISNSVWSEVDLTSDPGEIRSNPNQPAERFINTSEMIDGRIKNPFMYLYSTTQESDVSDKISFVPKTFASSEGTVLGSETGSCPAFIRLTSRISLPILRRLRSALGGNEENVEHNRYNDSIVPPYGTLEDWGKTTVELWFARTNNGKMQSELSREILRVMHQFIPENSIPMSEKESVEKEMTYLREHRNEIFNPTVIRILLYTGARGNTCTVEGKQAMRADGNCLLECRNGLLQETSSCGKFEILSYDNEGRWTILRSLNLLPESLLKDAKYKTIRHTWNPVMDFFGHTVTGTATDFINLSDLSRISSVDQREHIIHEFFHEWAYQKNSWYPNWLPLSDIFNIIPMVGSVTGQGIAPIPGDYRVMVGCQNQDGAFAYTLQAITG